MALKVIALAEQEAVDAGRRNVVKEVSEDDADKAGETKTEQDAHAHARKRQHCQPYAGKNDRRAKVRLLHQQHGDGSGHRCRKPEDRQRLVLLAQGQEPGHRDNEEGLEKLGRLNLADTDVDPARRAVHLGTENRHEHKQDEEEGSAGER